MKANAPFDRTQPRARLRRAAGWLLFALLLSAARAERSGAEVLAFDPIVASPDAGHETPAMLSAAWKALTNERRIARKLDARLDWYFKEHARFEAGLRETDVAAIRTAGRALQLTLWADRHGHRAACRETGVEDGRVAAWGGGEAGNRGLPPWQGLLSQALETAPFAAEGPTLASTLVDWNGRLMSVYGEALGEFALAEARRAFTVIEYDRMPRLFKEQQLVMTGLVDPQDESATDPWEPPALLLGGSVKSFRDLTSVRVELRSNHLAPRKAGAPAGGLQSYLLSIEERSENSRVLETWTRAVNRLLADWRRSGTLEFEMRADPNTAASVAAAGKGFTLRPGEPRRFLTAEGAYRVLAQAEGMKPIDQIHRVARGSVTTAILAFEPATLPRRTRHDGAVVAVAISPDGRLVASLSRRSLLVHSADSGQGRYYQAASDESGFGDFLAFESENRLLFCPGEGRLSRCTLGATPTLTALPLPDGFTPVAFHRALGLLAGTRSVTYATRDISSWRLDSPSTPWVANAAAPALAVFDASGERFAWWNSTGGIMLREKGATRSLASVGAPPWGLEFSADGNSLVVAQWQGLSTLPLAGGGPAEWALALRPSSAAVRGPGTMWAVATDDRSVLLLDGQGPKALRAARELPEQILHLAFSPDGRFLAMGGWFGLVGVIEAASARILWQSKPTPIAEVP